MYNDRILELRKEAGLNQTRIAEELGISRGRYSMYELGTRKTPIEILEAIADFYNVDMDYLVGKSDVKRKISIDDLKGNYELEGLLAEISKNKSAADNEFLREYITLDEHQKRMLVHFIKSIKKE